MSHGHHTDQEAFKCCISQVDGEKQQGGLRLFLKALITFNRTKRSPDHRQRSRPSRQLPPLIKSQSCETAVTRTPSEALQLSALNPRNGLTLYMEQRPPPFLFRHLSDEAIPTSSSLAS